MCLLSESCGFVDAFGGVIERVCLFVCMRLSLWVFMPVQGVCVGVYRRGLGDGKLSSVIIIPSAMRDPWKC